MVDGLMVHYLRSQISDLIENWQIELGFKACPLVNQLLIALKICQLIYDKSISIKLTWSDCMSKQKLSRYASSTCSKRLLNSCHIFKAFRFSANDFVADELSYFDLLFLQHFSIPHCLKLLRLQAQIVGYPMFQSNAISM